MFKEVEIDKTIPPNFLNSILTNPSLYDMFKNDFDANSEYFQGIKKEVYKKEMLKFIEDTLFSSNLFHIYGEVTDIEEKTKGKLDYIRRFYDDFLLDEFKLDPKNILKIRLFRGMEYARLNDLYASCSEEFTSLYDYIFKESLDYEGIIEVLLKEPLVMLKKHETLSMASFDTVCNYVKNNIDGLIDMDLAMSMLHNHAYKKNHIFDIEVAEEIVKSTITHYLKEYSIDVKVEFQNGLESLEVSAISKDERALYFDKSLLEGFVSLNYVVLFETAFYEADKLKDLILLEENREDYTTLRTIMNMVSQGVDLLSIKDTFPHEYDMDLRASAFIKTLRFFSLFGVNLLDSYINAKTKGIDEVNIDEVVYSKKEISLDQRFFIEFAKLPNKKELIKSFTVLKVIFEPSGTRKKAIDIIKSITDSNEALIIEYLRGRVVEPHIMIEDVDELSKYSPRNPNTKELIETELKYIFVDTFYYSLDSFIKLHKNTKFDLEEYVDDLQMKIGFLKDNELTHKFIDEALFTIGDAKQNL